MITGGESDEEETYTSSELWTPDKQLLLTSPLTVRRAGYHVQINRTICGGYEKALLESDDALRSCETLSDKMEWNRENITLKGERWGSIVFTNNNDSTVYIIGGVNGNQGNMERINGEDNQLVTVEREIRYASLCWWGATSSLKKMIKDGIKATLFINKFVPIKHYYMIIVKLWP